jgi:hypothetical protein
MRPRPLTGRATADTAVSEPALIVSHRLHHIEARSLAQLRRACSAMIAQDAKSASHPALHPRWFEVKSRRMAFRVW